MLAKFVDEKFPLWAKILLTIFGGAPAVYRVLVFVDSCIAKGEKKVIALVAAIVMVIIFPLLFVMAIIDLISLCVSGKFSALFR